MYNCTKPHLLPAIAASSLDGVHVSSQIAVNNVALLNAILKVVAVLWGQQSDRSQHTQAFAHRLITLSAVVHRFSRLAKQNITLGCIFTLNYKALELCTRVHIGG